MTKTISDADIAALVAVRSVIADAAHHPGRQAAIEAIDRLVSAPGCPDCEERKQADDRFIQMLGSSGVVDAANFHGAAEKLRAEFGLPRGEKSSKLPSWAFGKAPTLGQAMAYDDGFKAAADAAAKIDELYDRIHPTSGPLLSASPVVTQRQVSHQLFDAKCEATKTSDDGRTASLRGVVGQGCYVCESLLLKGKSVDMNVLCNGSTRTITTCGDQECRQAVERTNRMAPTLGGCRQYPCCGDWDRCKRRPPQLYAIKWTNPDGKSGLGAERASRAYLERSNREVPRKEGWSYEIVPAPEGDKEWRFERDFIPLSWFDEATGLIRAGAALALHGRCGIDCWKCSAGRFLESL